ncbi:Amiloride-sensitive sodium channel subunit gamma [Holothuria leucospilota]|uniref:Amiloride-sensitive sodium channel subunit gamma n=1 Tax=Holothuria leucospilota TaxID=206669 RepID=A0A9Q0YHS3_HOLLE|nr:Amiloride-sensitive sodium channel subunit gamma [Holothuria leucospilota]
MYTTETNPSEMPRRVVPNMSTPIVSSFEVEKPSNSKDRSFCSVLNKFATVTTAHGPFHIAVSENVFSKIFWTVMLIFAAGILTWQTYELIADYNSYNTASELIHSESIPFPAVTICNVNRMKRSLLTTSEKFSEVVRLDGGWKESTFKEYDWFWEELPDWWGDYSERLANATSGTNFTTEVYPGEKKDSRSEGQPNDDIQAYEYNGLIDNMYYDYGVGNSDCDDGDHEKFFETLGSNNFMQGVNRLFTPTKDDLEELGHKKEDFILQCSFNGRKCSHRNFTTFQNSRYGNCFTFNGTREATVSKAGSHYGLHLTLFIEEPEYVGVFSEETGARLLVHPKEVFPHVDDLGITLAPGFATQIGIRQVVHIMRLSLPYYNCSNGESDGHFTMTSHNYSIISCQKRCLLDAMRQNCGCVSEIYEDFNGTRLCSCRDDRCRQRMENLFTKNKLSCECPPPCNEILYNTQMSSSLWPARRYQDHLIEKLAAANDREAARVLQDPMAVRQNLVRVKVYFQELNYERVQQTPKHTIPTLFGAIGGIFGLYVGFSIFTFAEIIVLLLDIIRTALFSNE